MIVRGAHVNEDGQIISGPPPTDVADGSPAQDADGGNAIDPVSADNNNGLTPEELAGYIDEHPDSAIQDYDGDGDYEAGLPIDEGAAVTIEDGYVYVDTDGDGSADIVAAAEYYDPEANAIYVPVDPNDLNIHGDSGLINPSYGYISEDRDGDGVAERYLAVDFDWDGVADYVNYEHGEVFSDVIIRELDYVEASGDGSDFPGGTEEIASEEGKRIRTAARLKLFGGGGAVLAQSAPAALPADDVARALTDLKSLYDKGLLPDSQYEVMQGQALAALDPQATGVEGGLRLLRNFWDQGLINAAPYAAKRQEYLDAL